MPIFQKGTQGLTCLNQGINCGDGKELELTYVHYTHIHAFEIKRCGGR